MAKKPTRSKVGKSPRALKAEKRKEMEIAKRRKVVAANLMAGLTYRDIAEALGVSIGTISGDFKAILEEWREHYVETIGEWTNVQLRRLDVLINSIWEAAKKGDLRSIDRVMKLMEQQAKIMGINAPVKSEVTGDAFSSLLEALREAKRKSGNDDTE